MSEQNIRQIIIDKALKLSKDDVLKVAIFLAGLEAGIKITSESQSSSA